MAEVRFVFDVVCPFAYIASLQIERLAATTGAHILWEPVLLGGLYKATHAPQGANSSSSIQNAQKLRITQHDFLMQLQRYQVEWNDPPSHLKTPQQKAPTLQVMRVLTALPASARPIYAHVFYRARWVDGLDLTDKNVLQRLVSSVDQPSWGQLEMPTLDEVLQSEEVSKKLRETTEWAAQQGMFGVPSFWVESKSRFYWGVDRIHFVERALGYRQASPFRVMSRPTQHAQKMKHQVRFFFDFASPWSYLAAVQLRQRIEEVGVQVQLECVPILVGALFREIGTPNVPSMALSEAKRNAMQQDLLDWIEYVGEQAAQFTFNPYFPIRTVLPLRAVIAAKEFIDDVALLDLVLAFFRAAWEAEENIGDEVVVRRILDMHQVPVDQVMTRCASSELKNQLIQNNQMAVEVGCCGVPTFQVDDGPLLWGQDRLPILQDFLQGWELGRPKHSAKL